MDQFSVVAVRVDKDGLFYIVDRPMPTAVYFDSQFLEDMETFEDWNGIDGMSAYPYREAVTDLAFDVSFFTEYKTSCVDDLVIGIFEVYKNVKNVYIMSNKKYDEAAEEAAQLLRLVSRAIKAQRPLIDYHGDPYMTPELQELWVDIRKCGVWRTPSDLTDTAEFICRNNAVENVTVLTNLIRAKL